MASRESSAPRVVILGAGVNGCAVARELVLNGVSTWVVDANDISFGATSKSSRLIHGGLRYLEYGEFRLVQESLEERGRLRRLAPHFVRPLRLFIPVKSRLSGLAASALRFTGVTRLGFMKNLTRQFRRARGLWLVDLGLAFYDWFAAGPEFPKHTVHALGTPGTPEIDPHRCRWLAAYSDAQMWGTERFCVALLDDARRVAREHSIDFRVVTHADVAWEAGTLVIAPDEGGSTGNSDSMTAFRVRPELLVNATGAWGDRTLAGLNIPSPPLFGGTKGSHFVTWNRRLAAALHGQGVYAEANDGRLVFILPHGEAVLVGTTDERFERSPEEAVASDAELDYLVGMVNRLMPQVALTRDDIAMHYSGVRPLPRADGTTASVTRDHAVAPTQADGVTVLTLVGGKLTTCRAFGETVADDVMKRLGVVRTADTRTRVVPGNADYPPDSAAMETRIATLAERTGLAFESALEAWTLFGTGAEGVLAECGSDESAAERAEVIEGTAISTSVVRWIIRNEWVGTLDDLVERRLMLVFGRQLSEETLERVARCLVAEGKLADDDVERAVAATSARLLACYGRRVTIALAEV